jgi:MerR family transcriptional regulator/heat shock protein HspR
MNRDPSFPEHSPPGRSPGWRIEESAPVFVISVAAQLAGMHPQTLRQYDRLGLVSPGRTSGRGRRYSARDVAMLREIQRLSQEDGVNLAGIKRIIDLQFQVDTLNEQVRLLSRELTEIAEHMAAQSAQRSRVFAAGAAGDIVAMRPGRRPEPRPAPSSGALVVWRPLR